MNARPAKPLQLPTCCPFYYELIIKQSDLGYSMLIRNNGMKILFETDNTEFNLSLVRCMNYARNKCFIRETFIYSMTNRKLLSYKGWPPQLDLKLLDRLLNNLDSYQDNISWRAAQDLPASGSSAKK